MWFLFGLITAVCWGVADLFYKRGSDPADKYSHLKIAVMVGLVMGIHAVIYMLAGNLSFDPMNLIRYLPVSGLYILSMVLGYVGLRYITLSVSSPIQNSSGAIVTVLCFIFFTHVLSALEITGIVLVSAGVVLLAVFEQRAARRATPAEQLERDKKYRVGFVAILYPILYCLLDGLGTFADAIYLDELAIISEDEALLAYEFTFFLCAAAILVFFAIKKIPFRPIREKDKGFAAIFETAGQFFYVFAMAENAIITAPLVASYSIFSVILSRIFLKERLSKKQYAMIAAVLAGIALLGIADEL